MTAIEQFNEKIKAFEQQKKDLVKSLKKDLKEVLKEIFNTVPEIKVIYWTQYTPYFMDGDVCIFSMNDIIVSNSETEFFDYPEGVFDYADEEEKQPLWASSATSPGKFIKNPEHKKLLKDFSKLLYQSEALMQEVFGDNIRVIGTKKGFRIEDCSDHD